MAKAGNLCVFRQNAKARISAKGGASVDVDQRFSIVSAARSVEPTTWLRSNSSLGQRMENCEEANLYLFVERSSSQSPGGW